MAGTPVFDARRQQVIADQVASAIRFLPTMGGRRREHVWIGIRRFGSGEALLSWQARFAETTGLSEWTSLPTSTAFHRCCAGTSTGLQTQSTRHLPRRAMCNGHAHRDGRLSSKAPPLRAMCDGHTHRAGAGVGRPSAPRQTLTPPKAPLCRDPGLSRGPSDLQSDALPAELSRLLALSIIGASTFASN